MDIQSDTNRASNPVRYIHAGVDASQDQDGGGQGCCQRQDEAALGGDVAALAMSKPVHGACVEVKGIK